MVVPNFKDGPSAQEYGKQQQQEMLATLHKLLQSSTAAAQLQKLDHVTHVPKQSTIRPRSKYSKPYETDSESSTGDSDAARTGDPDLRKACLAWRRESGSRQVKFEPADPSPLQQGVILGKGGIGVVYQTTLDSVDVAWKRTYTRRLTEWYLNEIRILNNMPKE